MDFLQKKLKIKKLIEKVSEEHRFNTYGL